MTNECSRTRELFTPLEAVFTIAPEPIPTAQLAGVVNVEEVFILEASGGFAASCQDKDRGRECGFELRQNAGGWRIYSARPWADLMGRFIVGSATSRLSQAALKTLVVVAYRQPVSRLRISRICGVNVDAVARAPVARGLIGEVGEPVSGARLYGVTRELLEKMGFASLDELVPLTPYLPAGEEPDELEELLWGKMCTLKAGSVCEGPSLRLELPRVVLLKC